MAEIESEVEKPMLERIWMKGCSVAEEAVEVTASWQLGQQLLRLTDKALWTLEKSAAWSVPTSSIPKQTETNGTFGQTSPLTRPLPWVFFLPLLLLLRTFRACVNLASALVGGEGLKASSMVRWAQARRRRVRAIKFRGLRRMLHRPRHNMAADTADISWIKKVVGVVKMAVCVGYKHNDVAIEVVHSEKANEVAVAENTDHKRKYGELDSDEDVEEDPDYIPSDSDSEDDTESEGEENAEPVCNAKPLLKRPSSKTSLTNDVIEEENEDSESSTTTAASDDTQKRADVESSPTKNKNEKLSNEEIYTNANDCKVANQIDGVTSDEFFSPQEDSECPSPEPKKPVSCSLTKNDLSEPQFDAKITSQNIIASEQVQKSINGSDLCNEKTKMDAGHSSSNNYKTHGKRKNKKKMSNPFNRKRK